MWRGSTGKKKREQDDSSCSDESSDSADDSNNSGSKKGCKSNPHPPKIPKSSELRKLGCRLSKKLERMSRRQVLRFFLSLGSLLLLLVFLLVFRGEICRFGSIFLHSVLPASWTKSTNDIIDEALAKYSADKLGVADYALESAGSSVLCSSDTYYSKSGALYNIFGIPVWYHSSSPREVIQPEVQPGKCWAMDGHSGYVMVKLAMPVVVSAISLEHIPEEVALSRRLDSALREFVIVGKESEMSSPDVWLGKFVYQTHPGRPIQQFDIKDPNCARETEDYNSCGPNTKVFRIITLKVLSNHGNPDYTCIYRLRVHGKPQRSNDSGFPQPDH